MSCECPRFAGSSSVLSYPLYSLVNPGDLEAARKARRPLNIDARQENLAVRVLSGFRQGGRGESPKGIRALLSLPLVRCRRCDRSR